MAQTRLSILNLPPRRTGADMKRFLRSQLFHQSIQSSSITCCICQKLNQTGVLYNERFLWLLEGDSIYYGKILQDKDVIPFKSLKDLPSKKRVLMEHVVEFEIGRKESDGWIKIRFKGEKGADVVWEFRMPTRTMCLKWKSKLEDSKEANNRMHLKQLQSTNSIIKKENELDFSLYYPRESLKQEGEQQNEKEKERQREMEREREKEKQRERQREIEMENERQKERLREKEREGEKEKQKAKLKQKLLAIDTTKPLTETTSHIEKPTITTPKKKSVEFLLEVSSPTFKKREKQDDKSTQLKRLKQQLQIVKQNTQTLMEESKLVDWQHSFSTQSNLHEMIDKFNSYCEAITFRLVDELLLTELERSYKPIIVAEYSMEYQIDQVYVKLCWPLPPEDKEKQKQKEKQKGKEKERVDPLESCEREHKCFQYILLKTQNKCLLKVPLTTIISYKGMNVFFKVNPQCSSPSLFIKLQYLSSCVQEFSKATHIPVETMMAKESFIFPAPDGKALILRDSANIFPLDPHNYIYPVSPKIYETYINSKQKRQNQPVPIFLSEGQLQDSRVQGNTPFVDEKVDELLNISKAHDRVITQAIYYMESSLEKLVSITDFFAILNQYGLSLFDLKRLYKLSSIPFMQNFIFTTLCIVSFTKIFRYRLAVEIKNLVNKKSMKYIERESSLLNFAIYLLNKALFGNRNSEDIWKGIGNVVKYQFGIECSVGKEQIIEGLFKQGVLDWASGLRLSIGQSQQLSSTLTRKEAVKFKPTITSTDLAWTPFYSQILQTLKSNQESSFNDLVNLLELKKKTKFPIHLPHCSFKNKLISFLASHISPLSKEYKLKLYRQAPLFPKWIDYHLMKLNYVHLMKANKEHQARNIKSQFMELLTFWGGKNHPFRMEFLLVEQRLYFNSNSSRAIVNGKNLLIEALEHQSTIGDLKVSECYKQLALSFMAVGRFPEALSDFSRCKSLIDKKKPKNPQYYQLVLNIAKLNLNQDNLKECMENIFQCLSYYELKGNNQSQLVECCELLYRCHLLTGSYPNVIRICESQLSKVKKVENFEVLLRILSSKAITSISPEVREQLVRYWRKQMKHKNYNPEDRCRESQQYLMKTVSVDELMGQLQYLEENGKVFLKEMLEMKILPLWKDISVDEKGEEDEGLALMHAMYYFLGEGFILQQ